MTMLRRSRHTGFTLVEVLVALVLFSLIGIAGFSLVDGLMRVQHRTEGRLERLAELQRAMHLMTLDFEQITSDALSVEDTSVSFRRFSASEGDIGVRYALVDGTLRRTLSSRRGAPRVAQRLISRVEALDWYFFVPELGWQPTWPPAASYHGTRPTAIAAVVSLSAEAVGPSGSLRRVVQLPARSDVDAL